MLQHYADVEFDFLSTGYDAVLRGVVIVRDGEMVLEIQCPGDRPYLVTGKATRDFFRGRHEPICRLTQ